MTDNETTVPERPLRDAIAEWARADDTDRPTHGEAMVEWDRADLARALESWGITLEPWQLEVAHAVLARRSFMGGNYTLDARAVRSALADAEETR